PEQPARRLAGLAALVRLQGELAERAVRRLRRPARRHRRRGRFRPRIAAGVHEVELRVPEVDLVARGARNSHVPHDVFLTGATGYIGRHLIPELLARGHTVRALVRAGSEGKLPKGAVAVPGNALDRSTFASQVAPSDTFIQLVGVAHPSPAKAQQFREV